MYNCIQFNKYKFRNKNKYRNKKKYNVLAGVGEEMEIYACVKGTGNVNPAPPLVKGRVGYYGVGTYAYTCDGNKEDYTVFLGAYIGHLYMVHLLDDGISVQ